MGVSTSAELQESCKTFATQIQAHHATASSLLGDLTTHVGTWVSDCDQWIGGETSKLNDELQSVHMPALKNFIDWAEAHPSVVLGMAEKAAELFAEVLG